MERRSMSGTLETIAQGDGSRVVEPRRFIARKPAAFAAIWAAHAGPDSPVPPVDFESKMVAAVFAGERPTPGFEVLITGSALGRHGLTILVDERVPDPASLAAQIIVSPFHIATLPRFDGEIHFRSSKDHLGAIHPEPHAADSSTGLTPQAAAALAYLAGPFSGALLLAVERTSRFVRFHAWQAVLGLGGLGLVAGLSLVLAFLMLIASPTAFWVMLWLSAFAAVAWIVAWGVCLFQAYKGRSWKLPLAGNYAERYTID
jgi:uncharacterized membrane protein